MLFPNKVPAMEVGGRWGFSVIGGNFRSGYSSPAETKVGLVNLLEAFVIEREVDECFDLMR